MNKYFSEFLCLQPAQKQFIVISLVSICLSLITINCLINNLTSYQNSRFQLQDLELKTNKYSAALSGLDQNISANITNYPFPHGKFKDLCEKHSLNFLNTETSQENGKEYINCQLEGNYLSFLQLCNNYLLANPYKIENIKLSRSINGIIIELTLALELPKEPE